MCIRDSVCDVRPPDADTRRAILLKKAVDLGCALPLDVADFVSASITTSVRALEGALVRLSAWSQLAREPLTLDIAKENDSVRVVRYRYGMSEGNSYRFEDKGDCWYLSQDPEAPAP